MAIAAKTPRMLGQPIKRREDPKLITGAGQYLDDLSMPGDAAHGRGAEPVRPRPDQRHRRQRRARRCRASWPS